MGPARRLTAIKDVLSRLLLGTVHAQAIVMLHFHIGTNVLALVSLSRWKPLCQILVALRLVDIISDGEELWTSDAEAAVSQCSLIDLIVDSLVCECLTLISGPVLSTGDPGFFQRNNVVDIDI